MYNSLTARSGLTGPLAKSCKLMMSEDGTGPRKASVIRRALKGAAGAAATVAAAGQ